MISVGGATLTGTLTMLQHNIWDIFSMVCFLYILGDCEYYGYLLLPTTCLQEVQASGWQLQTTGTESVKFYCPPPCKMQNANLDVYVQISVNKIEQEMYWLYFDL